MIIELAEKKVIDIVKANMEAFKKIEDEKLKSVVTEIESALKEYDTALENVKVESDVKEEPKVEEKVAETIKEPVKEVKKEEPVKVDEPKKEVKPVVEHKIEAKDVQLSMDVAKKLREAALELDNQEKIITQLKTNNALELKARDEIINGYKSKIIELNNDVNNIKQELDVYKKREALELDRQKKQLKLDLIELYSKLNMTKTQEDFDAFGMTQLVELRKALDVTLEKKNTPVRETINSNVTSVKRQQKDVLTPKETFEGIFGKNPDIY